MTHEDEGNYKGKHQSQELNEQLAEMMRDKVGDDNLLRCVVAEQIAADNQTTMPEVGRTADLIEIKLGGCQMGLFGYPRWRKGTGAGIVVAAESVSDEMKTVITNALEDGKLPCSAAWSVASKLKVTKIEVASACEALKIKVKACQLGAF